MMLLQLKIIAKELLEKEIIFQSDLVRLIGKRPFEKETTYEAYTETKESPAPSKIELDKTSADEVEEKKEA